MTAVCITNWRNGCLNFGCMMKPTKKGAFRLLFVNLGTCKHFQSRTCLTPFCKLGSILHHSISLELLTVTYYAFNSFALFGNYS